MKTAVITGASRGIGYHLAVKMAETKTAERFVLAARTVSGNSSLKDALGKYGCEFILVDADLATREGVEKVFAAARDKGWKVDILVNNAGRGIYKPIAEESYDTISQIINLNVTGLIYLTALFAGDLIERRGTVVNIASVAGRKGIGGLSVYCATKWAVVGFSESIRDELFSKKVRIITVEPGLVDTDWGEELPESFIQYKQSVEMLKPEQVAETILFA
ncbi:MAG: SDR family NAD(P)-dependent oxidoreductase, partial [Deltaproteobacteria bacterium]